MKKLAVKLFAISLILIFAFQVDAQVSNRSRRIPEQKKVVSFADHLWYGGGFGLSFSGGLGNLSGNTFSVGLSPMLGYKLNNIFSVGPRFEIKYTNGRYQEYQNTPVIKFNGFDYGAGIFARAKFVRILFAHVELSYVNKVYPAAINNNKIVSERLGDNQFLAGIGYTSGTLASSEIYLLYDFLAAKESTQIPLVYRFGFTYKF